MQYVQSGRPILLNNLCRKTSDSRKAVGGSVATGMKFGRMTFCLYIQY